MADPIVTPPAGQAASGTPAPSVTPPTTATPPAGAATPAPKPAAPGVTPPAALPAGTVPLSALQEERERRQALTVEVENLKKLVTQIGGQSNQTTYTAPAPDNTQFQQQMEHLWETDPRKAVQTEILAAFNWYDRVQADVDSQMDQVAKKYVDFNNYRSEVNGYIRQMPPDQRAKQGVVELAYYAVRGQKVDEIIAANNAELLRKIQAGEAVQGFGGGTFSAPVITPGVINLTDEQKRVAQAMHMTEADYAKHMSGKS